MDLKALNDMQMAAVTKTEGAVLVLAGAGSGKTRVLTLRAAYLIGEKGVSPYTILALTFTNKAAEEMATRIRQYAGDRGGLWVSTFHSACARILRADIDKLGYTRNFSIYDEADTVSLLKDVLKRQGFDRETLTPKSARWRISRAKNAGVSPARYAHAFPGPDADEMAAVYAEYEKRLKGNNALDFDDLLLKTLLLFKNHPDVLAHYGNRFQYIMVDEYQDTNLVQYEILRSVASFHGNLFVVGDDDQAIYGWRGADIRNILEFERDFPGAAVIRLERNYRSHQKILDAANSVISHNDSRKGKKLWTNAKEGALPVEYSAPSDTLEAAFIASEIQRLRDAGVSYGEMAVMYRVNSQSRVIEDELIKRAVPYRVYGGIGFYERKEIKDIAAYLNLIVNTRADISCARIINEPRRGIGQATLERLGTAASSNGLSLYEACREAGTHLDARAAANVKRFVHVVDALISDKPQYGVSEFIDAVLERTGYWKSLSDEDTPEARARVENLEEFLNTAVQYENQSEAPSLEGFLERNALIADIDHIGEEKESVTLITLHSAKGLEFDAVFMAGMQESLMPHAMALREDGLEEERRLCYVGMTRAKKKLYLCRSKTRLVYSKSAQGRPYDIVRCERSRFLGEIPRDMLTCMGEERAEPRERPARREQRKESNTAFPFFERNTARPERSNPHPEAIRAGVRVWHNRFGNGVVKTVRGSGQEQIAVVDFEEHGEKKMFVAFAPLSVVEQAGE